LGIGLYYCHEQEKKDGHPETPAQEKEVQAEEKGPNRPKER
jgi:hypothetical protein